MSERIFASIGEFGMELTTITGSQGALGNLYIKGTQYHSPEVGPQTPRELGYNYENKLVYGGVDHKERRGLTLAIFNSSMSVTFLATYDVFADDVAKNNLSNKLKEINENELAVLVSYDSIKSNKTLDDTLASFRSVSWPTMSHLNVSPNWASSYSCVICGRKKKIVAENYVGHGAPSPDAIIELAFSDPQTIGHSGFGHPLISDGGIYQTNTSDSIIKKWFDRTPISELSLKSGDEFLFHSLGEIDAIAAADHGHVLYVIEFFDNSGNSTGRFTNIANSVEAWQEVIIRNTIPSASFYLTASASCMKDDGTPPVGTCYVKNTTMTLSDNSQSLATSVSFGVYGSSAKNYADSLGNFNHHDPKGYYEEAKSERNLVGNVNLDPASPEPIRWMNIILDDDKERIVMQTDGDLELGSSEFDIDPKKFYYACVWVNKQEKSSGEIKLGLLEYDRNKSELELTSTDGSTKSKKMFSQTPSHDDLEDRQWYLVQGFILPHHIDQDRANKFIEDNKEFYGWDDIYGTGIGLSNEGTGEYGWISHQDSVRAKLTFVDDGNQGDNSKTLWALPMVRELRIGSVDIDDGLLSSISLSG